MAYIPHGRPKNLAPTDDSDKEALERIATVSQQAKAAWFGLLAALVFVTVTLMGHQDSDFFAFGAATTLPVIGLDVPPEAFFLAAPILIAALYVYLHLYLLNLWEALSDAPPVIRGKALAKRAHPTMITAAALDYRNTKQQDASAEPRAMGWLNSLASFALVWLFGWAVMAALWWMSQPAHYWWLTYPLGVMLFALIAVGVRSVANARRRLSGLPDPHGWGIAALRASWRVPVFILIGFVSYVRIDGQALPKGYEDYLSRADLREKHLTIRPADFRDRAEWMADFEHQYRVREGITLGKDMTADQKAKFTREAKTRRRARLSSLQKRSLRGRDLRGAYTWDAFLAGADLREAQMEGADLYEAQMEGANLWGAKLKSADLRDWIIVRTSLRSADFTGAKNMDQAAVNTAFGDRATILPDGIVAPCHWQGIEPLEFGDPGWIDLADDTAYQSWLQSWQGDTPPPCPEEDAGTDGG